MWNENASQMQGQCTYCDFNGRCRLAQHQRFHLALAKALLPTNYKHPKQFRFKKGRAAEQSNQLQSHTHLCGAAVDGQDAVAHAQVQASAALR